ncbi:hypothetical protein TeGR_g4902 [Tetraparma gracilis]|uniref:Smr domain-containing protein n=1 Tax=Tetraparma gracilis TaxID=2962635 RepID=A0ABQ6M3N3_9STRA|nr:hypothetical protein TeGR_g4902 [Tetraparma gracilis]
MGLFAACFGFLRRLLCPPSRPAKQAGPRSLAASAAEKHRAAAHVHAESRGRLLGQSQAAYKRGDKKAAHDLSVQGKAAGKKMEAENLLARRAIVEPQGMLKGGRVDLHGLFLAEALAVVEEFLAAHLKSKRFKQLLIVTGAGHHSAHKDQPVIRPRVEALLKERGVAFEEVHKRGALLLRVPGGREPLPGGGKVPDGVFDNAVKMANASGHKDLPSIHKNKL